MPGCRNLGNREESFQLRSLPGQPLALRRRAPRLRFGAAGPRWLGTEHIPLITRPALPLTGPGAHLKSLQRCTPASTVPGWSPGASGDTVKLGWSWENPVPWP